MRDYNRDEINKEKVNRSHYNRLEAAKVMDLFKKDPYRCLELYENYFNSYPDDFRLYAYYISTLISVSQLDKAEEHLNKLEHIYNTHSFYEREPEKRRYLTTHLCLDRIKLYMYQNRIEELLDFYYNNYQVVKFLSDDVKLYFDKLRGKDIPKRKSDSPYCIRQVTEYQESDFLDHIKKHLADYNMNTKEISKAFFAPDFPIEKVITEIKKYIPSDKKVLFGYIENTYVFKYDGCGRDDDKLVDYFKVITFHNTANCITMYPSKNCSNLPCVDLNYLHEKNEEEENAKVKKLSQIDKFNRKYHRNAV